MEIYYREKHVALQAMKIFIINISAVMIIIIIHLADHKY